MIKPGRDSVLEDIAAVARIDVVKQILEVICRTTGLGYAAIARVTDGRWIACAVRDEMAFGLEPGGELEEETTICHQVRCRGRAVTIDDTETDTEFNSHSAPEQFGFRSCISVPIRLADGSMFGTLCAIAAKPIHCSAPEVVSMFTLFADLIGKHLDTQAKLTRSELALGDERRLREQRQMIFNLLDQDLRRPLTGMQDNIERLIGETGGRPTPAVADLKNNLTQLNRVLDNARALARPF